MSKSVKNRSEKEAIQLAKNFSDHLVTIAKEQGINFIGAFVVHHKGGASIGVHTSYPDDQDLTNTAIEKILETFKEYLNAVEKR